MSLIIDDPKYLTRVLRFAEDKRLMPKLLDQLWWMHTYADHADDKPEQRPEFALESGGQFPPPEWTPHGKATTCRLYPDSAPASFYFVIENAGTRWFNGGLIYHGDQSGWQMLDGRVIPPGYEVETFSVAFGIDTQKQPWSIHT